MLLCASCYNIASPLQVVYKGTGDTLPKVMLILSEEGDEVNLNHWLAKQPLLFRKPTHLIFEQ